MTEEKKRLFFGIEVFAPWPEEMPPGRMLAEEDRHLTLVFLGNVLFAPLQELLPSFPAPPFPLGTGGIFDRCLFLPPRRPRVVAWHGDLRNPRVDLVGYHRTLVSWLQEHALLEKKEERDFLPHATLCRPPFERRRWEKAFHPLPFVMQNIHLYESLGSSRYAKIWTHSLLPAFEEMPHTADIAFRVRGRSWEELSFHAQIALAFCYPALVSYLAIPSSLENLDDVIIDLNQRVSRADQEIGAPFKAVSYSGRAEEKEVGIQTWEMIVDV